MSNLHVYLMLCEILGNTTSDFKDDVDVDCGLITVLPDF